MSQPISRPLSRPLSRWAALALIWLMGARMLHAATMLSPVVDEQSHISRGLSVLRTGDLRLTIGHPLGLNAWVALPLVVDSTVRLPLDDESWARAAWDRFGDQFLWRVNANADAIVFRSRVMVILLALVLAALVFHWALALTGPAGGLLALALFTFDPNILAHGMLATTDLGVTLFIFAATYTLWRTVCTDSLRWASVTGLLVGLALVAKYSALLVLPIFGLTALAIALHRRRRPALRSGPPMTFRHQARRAVAATTLLLLASLLVLLLVYVGHLAAYVKDLRFILSATQSHPAFLLGRRSAEGWWTYFPITFALKTPLPELALFGLGLLASARRRSLADVLLLLPPALYFGLSIASGFNIGYRHLLPILPFLAVIAAGAVQLPARRPVVRNASILLMVAWLAVAALRIHPNYLTYFNALAPRPHWDVLVDSNLDWGQGLKQLARHLEQRGIERVNLSTFGPGDPASYGIRYDPLPRWPPPSRTDFRPANPAPGVYAISASNLQGLLLADPNAFDWFRRRAPDDVVAGSILIYRVAPDPDSPRAVGLCRVPWTPLNPEDVSAVLGRAQRRIVRFDCADAWWWPGGPTWYLLPRELVNGPFGHVEFATDAYRLLRQERAPTVRHSLPEPARFAGGLTLLGYDWPRPPRAGEAFELTSVWRVDGPVTPPVSIFGHLLDDQGTFVAGADGLGVPAEELRPGDVIWQKHRLGLPQESREGDYRVELGFYRLDTLQRYPAQVGGQARADRVLTDPVRVSR